MKKAIYLCFVLLGIACNAEKDDLNLCENPIKLSQDNLRFSSEGGVDTITIDRDFWWVARMTLDEKNILVQGDIYDKEFEIKGKNFTIEKKTIKKVKDTTHLIIKMMENKTGKDRVLTLMLQSGHCVTYLPVTQSGEE